MAYADYVTPIQDDDHAQSLLEMLGLAPQQMVQPPQDQQATSPSQGTNQAEATDVAPTPSSGLTNTVSAPTAPSPKAAPVSTPYDDRLKQDQAKLDALKAQGAGVSNKHGILGGLLKGLDIAGSILMPNAMAAIPGTRLNFAHNVNAAQNQVAQDTAGQNSSLDQQYKSAEIQEKLNPPQKDGNAELQTFNDLQQQTNPATGKPYTAAEAFQKVNEIREQAKPQPVKPGDEPLKDRVPQLNQLLTQRYQVLHPGQPLPAASMLSGDATAKDYDRIDKALEATERATGTKAQQDSLSEMRRQTMALKNQKATTEESAIETAAQSLANGDLTRLKDIASMRGDQRLLIYNRAKQLNPKFNTAEVDRKVKMADSFSNGKDGQQLQSFGTFLEHAGEAHDIVEDMRKSQSTIPVLNKPLNWYKQNLSGDPNYQRFITSLEPVRKEFEGFLLGGHALYAEDRKAAETILSDNSSPAQIQSALKQMGHTVKARYNEMNNRYKGTMKQDLPPETLSDEAKAGASKIGLNLGGSNGSGAQPYTGHVVTRDQVQAVANSHFGGDYEKAKQDFISKGGQVNE
jgi:hypothetical protein